MEFFFCFAPKQIVKKNGFNVILEIGLARIHSPLFSISLQEFMTNKPAKLKCNILFLKKNDKYVLDVLSVRIRIFDEMTLNQKPLVKFFSWGSFCANPREHCANCTPYNLSGNTDCDQVKN